MSSLEQGHKYTLAATVEIIIGMLLNNVWVHICQLRGWMET